MTRITRGFHGRRRPDVDPARVPPGQYVTQTSLPRRRPRMDRSKAGASRSAGRSTSRTPDPGRVPGAAPRDGDAGRPLRTNEADTVWTGVSLDTLLDGVETSAEYVTAFSDGGYTTNLPLEDLTGGRAWIAFSYDDEPLHPEHGGPARLLVPHLYFWKSAKWVRGLELQLEDEPGFWEGYGYHNYGDPWREQRYAGD